MAREPVTAADRDAFRASLRATAAFGDDDLAAAEAHCHVRVLRAGEVFLRCGDRATECGVVVNGLVREYFPLADGREVTRGFAGSGNYVGSLSDLLTEQAARSQVAAERPTRLVLIAWAKMAALVQTRPAWAAHHARIVERLYLAKAQREYELLALDAEARYARFRALYARLEPDIALRHVASYVGITPEHLSRLRRRLDGDAAARSPARTRSETRTSARRSRPVAAPPARRRARSPAAPRRR